MACSGVTACCAVALGAAVGLPVGEHETRAVWVWGRLGAFVCRGRGRGTVLVHAGLGMGEGACRASQSAEGWVYR